MTPRLLNIGQAAEAAGVSAKQVRHYEALGLLPPPARSEAGYRLYGEREVSVLRFIRQARRLGFSMAQIAELLGLWSDRGRASREVKAIAQRHLADLTQKMRELAEMQSALERLTAACTGDDDPHCAILEELAAASPEPCHAAGRVAPAAPPHRAGAGAAPGVAGPADRENADPPPHQSLMAWTHRGHAAR